MEEEIDQENHSEDGDMEASENQLLCDEFSQEYDSFGDPEILPRVGDEYQAKLPHFVTDSDQIWPANSEIYVNNIDVASHKFLVGLPLSITWVPRELTNIKQESAESSNNSIDGSNKDLFVKSECLQEAKAFSENCKPKVEPVDVATTLGESDKLALQCQRNIHMHHQDREQRYRPIPYSSGDSWDDIEEAAFLLGLYIFGKNLVLVQKFVESKKMGDMLLFYYGKFYKSERYRRWSECRKMRRRKCIYGQRIFTGSRQQEFLSRLLPHVSEEHHNALWEVSKTFGEGKMSLEEYVFSLKATVGLNSLINTVGIGKGKEDLTGISLEPLKPNHVVTAHTEIPVGKACSMLTPLEIINFLTGNYRLSKARSNDLFWEAVWPRLLARGWHSEQPKDHIYAAGSKPSLVFLIPGVKKFSRRKLVKGNHYFDSVSDVLNRVASDPGLLELEIGAEKGENSQEESGYANGSTLEKNDSSNQQCHCYLKPRTPNHRADFMKFTIVDTSLVNGGTSKVRELRSLPVEMNSTHSHNHSDESEQETSEDSTGESDSESDSSLPHDKGEGNCYKPTEINFESGLPSNSNTSSKMFQVHASGSTKVAAIPEDEKTKIKSSVQSRQTMKDQPSKRMKPGDKGQVAKRRRRLSACGRTEATRTSTSVSSVACSEIKQVNSGGCRDSPHVSAPTSLKGVPHEQKLSSPSPLCNSLLTSEAILSSTCAGAENINDEVQHALIDLNLPVHPELESDVHLMADVPKREHGEVSTEPSDVSVPNASGCMSGPELQCADATVMKASVCMPESEVQPVMNARRQSTRNRPLTTKALEALACGFLSTTQKRKQIHRSPPPKSSKTSCRARGGMSKTDAYVGSVVNLKVEERGHSASNCNGVIEQASDAMQVEMGSNLGVSQLVNK